MGDKDRPPSQEMPFRESRPPTTPLLSSQESHRTQFPASLAVSPTSHARSAAQPTQLKMAPFEAR